MARNEKAKEYASLAAHVEDQAESAPGNHEVPALEPWVEGDLKLRQLAQRIETDYLEFCGVAQTAMNENWHQKFGFVDASDYFDQRIGLSYRTVRRRLAILEAIQRLPEAEQEGARLTLSELGAHKASAIAPMLGKPDLDWKAAAEFAKTAPETAVQSMVSEKLGHAHRGLAASQHPGSRFYDYVLNTVPPDERQRTEFVFQQLMKMAGSHNAMAVFLVLVGLGEQELAAHGITRE
jgi:hypothetical protein